MQGFGNVKSFGGQQRTYSNGVCISPSPWYSWSTYVHMYVRREKLANTTSRLVLKWSELTNECTHHSSAQPNSQLHMHVQYVRTYMCTPHMCACMCVQTYVHTHTRTHTHTSPPHTHHIIYCAESRLCLHNLSIHVKMMHACTYVRRYVDIIGGFCGENVLEWLVCA